MSTEKLRAAVWAAHSPVPAASAGTHPAAHVHPGALATAARHHVPLQPQVPQRLDQVLQPGDVVITVCDRAHEELPTTLEHAHWSVADPARGGQDEAFDRAWRELTDRITRLAQTVQPTPVADPHS